MCVFHKWTKWTEPKDENFTKRTILRGVIMSEREVSELVQTRTCTKCGMVQRRVIET